MRPGLGPAKHDVLDHRHRVHQHEMLMDHRDAARHCVRRPVPDEALPPRTIEPASGAIEAEQHLHQRALARAVLAQEAEDFPGVEIKIDAVDRPHRAEAASDPAHFEKLAHGRSGPTRQRLVLAGRAARRSQKSSVHPPLRASCSVGAIFSAPLLN